MKWNLLPAAIGLLMVSGALWLVLVLTTRIALSRHERGSVFCAGATGTDWPLAAARLEFDTRTPCLRFSRSSFDSRAVR